MGRHDDAPLLDRVAEFIVWHRCHLEEAYRRAMAFYGGAPDDPTTGARRGLWSYDARRKALDRLRKKYPPRRQELEQAARDRGFPGFLPGSILGTWHWQDEAHHRNAGAIELRELASRVAAELEAADRQALAAKARGESNRKEARHALDRARRLGERVRDACAELRRALEELPN